MELMYYMLTFLNQKEFIVLIESNHQKEFLNTINNSNILSLQKQDSESEPVTFMPGTLFTYQKISKDMVGAQSKVWKVV